MTHVGSITHQNGVGVHLDGLTDGVGTRRDVNNLGTNVSRDSTAVTPLYPVLPWAEKPAIADGA